MIGAIIVPASGSPSQKQKPTSRHNHHQHKATASDSLLPPPLVVDTSSVDSSDSVRANLIREINRWGNVRYRRGGQGMKGIDCSGFTMKVFEKALAIPLPHSSAGQSKLGERVEKTDLEFGDLVFFLNKYKRINHVGIYLSDGTFVHSSRSVGVAVDSLSEKYYSRRFAGGRRVIGGIDSEPSTEP